jgi:glycosyltransferase involved in cell wall biosynthesis
MRLLHVYSGNLFGGIETMLLACAGAPTGRSSVQHEFALCFDDRLAAGLRVVGRPVHVLGSVRLRRPGTMLAARRALGAVIDGGRFDRVVCHAPWTQAMFGPVVRSRDVPLVFWAHDVMSGRHWTERLARRVVPDLVVCNSAFTAGTSTALYPDVRAAVVHPPVAAAAASARPDDADLHARRLLIRASLDTSASAFVIVQASRCEAWKGHALLLEALATLADQPDWVWWVVGGAQRPEEETYLATLRAAAARARVTDRIRWTGQRADVPRLLGAADVLCQANLEPEPFGVVFIEALAAGLPVVTIGSGGAREIVDETCGILTPPGDARALGAALERLMRDRTLRARLAGAAPARARGLCDPIRQLDRLRDALVSMPPVGATA